MLHCGPPSGQAIFTGRERERSLGRWPKAQGCQPGGAAGSVPVTPRPRCVAAAPSSPCLSVRWYSIACCVSLDQRGWARAFAPVWNHTPTPSCYGWQSEGHYRRELAAIPEKLANHQIYEQAFGHSLPNTQTQAQSAWMQ